jgi:hypothetical protein
MIRYLVAATLMATSALAQTNQMHDHMNMSHNMSAVGHDDDVTQSAVPTEPGQSAFAAIQEIVEMLVADDKTDWSKVDIPALRAHLIDMNNVTLYANVSAIPIDDGMRFEVTGTPKVAASIQRMVTAHAAMMNGVNGFSYETEELPNGAVLIAHTAHSADRQKLKALGFIGIMTLGAHHQQHHLAIALGENPHKH